MAMAVLEGETGAASAAVLRTHATGGASATLQLICLRAMGAISRLIQNRGMQTCTWRLARHVFGGKNSAVLEMVSGGRLKIGLGDGYWTRLLIPGYVYEPEIWPALSRVLAEPGVYFLDCGANIGYWSVVCSQFLPAGRVVAVEASPPNYAQLSANARLNDEKFKTVWGALWERDGEDAVIVSHDLRHAGSSIVDRREKIGKAGYRQYTVSTITLDTLCDRYVCDPEAGIVVKLDVEGAEIQALRGASRAFSQRPVLLLYEDHGRDREASVSDFVIRELGFSVYACGEDGAVRRMRTLADIRSEKADANTGYNFAAFSPESPFARLFAGS
jgi:FkbM family methyltransferase